ncbi:signal transduction histidine kinase [Paucibacter oligotrophus]|uniref:histidine kinase n=1 Tax=Roseateles oligotrophus TaxID=1769250 RepID=A0A840L8S3_9BURK|nr:ATP-binding protein [Roseateles oligotrophus]MBB4842608.1 signal transduction histidine kinase [Roseateles oligotrophus]
MLRTLLWPLCSLWLALLLIGTPAAAAAAAATVLDLASGPPRLALQSFVSVREDSSASLDREQILAGGEALFIPMADNNALLQPGFSASAFWLCLRLRNTANTPVHRVLTVDSARAENVAFHLRQDGQWRRSAAGMDQAFERRALPHRLSALELELPPQGEALLLIRIAGRPSISLGLHLWRPADLTRFDRLHDGLAGALAGAHGLMALIALLLFVSLRRPTYLLIGAFLLSYLFYEASVKGYAFMFLWPTALDWAPRAIGVFGNLMILLLGLSHCSMLEVRQRQRRLYRLGLLLLAVDLALLGYAVLGEYRQGALLLMLMNLCILMLSALFAARATRYRPRLAWPLLASIVLQGLGWSARQSARLGLSPDNAWSEYGLPLLGLLSCLLILCVAIAQLLQIERDKRSAQEHLLAERHAQQERLEAAVARRTTELAQASANAQASNAAKSRLLAYIGHDLRAPLASVLHLTRSMSSESRAQVERARVGLERSCLLLLDMIDELQAFARNAPGQEQAPTSPADKPTPESLQGTCYLHGLLQDLAAQGELLARVGGNRFDLQIAEDLPALVVLDAKLLRQVLLNLLSNAAKFTANGEVKLSASVQAGRLHFDILDNGPGIAEQDLGLLFKPFERAPGTSHLPGMGLGLSIAAQAARTLGGEIKLSSQLGQGSCFSFELGLQIGQEQDVLMPPSQSLPRHCLDLGQGRSALVLEPCLAMQDRHAERLLEAGFDVWRASSLAQDLEWLRTETPDLLVSEALLPEGPLEAAWPSLRAKQPQLKLLLCCARPPQAWVDQAFVLKPARDEEWWPALEALLRPQADIKD